MKRYLFRLVLIAGAFYFLFPLLPGVEFKGNFGHALLAGALFAFLGWLLEIAAVSLTALLTIGTFGAALLVLVPAWLFGFWLLPAVTLRWTADLMPTALKFDGWIPAIEGGLIMLVIGIVTSGVKDKVGKKKD